MNRQGKVGLVSWAILLSGLLSGLTAQAFPLEVTVATDKPAYVPGELLIVGVTAHNPTDTDVTLHFPTSEQAWYAMDDVYDNRSGSFQVLTSQLIPAFNSYTWSMTHNWSEFDLSLGTHTVQGFVVGTLSPGVSEPVTFEVVPATLPDSDVLIDFTHLPDGRILPAGSSLTNAYAAWGVHFGTFKNGGIDEIGVSSYQNNQYAAVNSTSYPPGFNILAQFDTPVHGVSAKVSAAAGYSVTMVAKDIDGQIIDSVTSDTVPVLHEFVGALKLHSTTPIASVEWWPSEQNVGIMVDDLYLSPLGPALPGDLDGDGFVGINDLNIVLGAWNQAALSGSSPADPSGDGYVGIEDLDIVLDAWNTGIPRPTVVPEPAAITLLGLGGVALNRLHRVRHA